MRAAVRLLVSAALATALLGGAAAPAFAAEDAEPGGEAGTAMIGASACGTGDGELPGGGAGGEGCGAGDARPGGSEGDTEGDEHSCDEESDDGETGAGGDGAGIGSGGPGVGGGAGVGTGGGSAVEPDRTVTTGAASTAIASITSTVLPASSVACGGECEPISFARPAAILPIVTTTAAGLQLRGTAPVHVPEIVEPASSGPATILVSAAIVAVLAAGGVLIVRRVRARL